MYVNAILFCNRNLTDGVVYASALKRLVRAKNPLRYAKLLVSVGLLSEIEEGFEVINYLERQRSADKIRDDKTKGKERVDKHRAKKSTSPENGNGNVTPLQTRDTSVEDGGNVTPLQCNGVTPYKKRREEKRTEVLKTSGKPDAPPREDIDSLCNLLADLIERNGSDRPTVGKAWLDAARLLLDGNGRDKKPKPFGELESVLRWSQNDSFWKSNILSMPTFREKYDQLRLQRDRGTISVSGPIVASRLSNDLDQLSEMHSRALAEEAGL